MNSFSSTSSETQSFSEVFVLPLIPLLDFSPSVAAEDENSTDLSSDESESDYPGSDVEAMD